jgi:hypothetical protein
LPGKDNSGNSSTERDEGQAHDMTTNMTSPAARTASSMERRGTRRCKITQMLFARPSDPDIDHFEDMRPTLSVSRNGIYFETSLPAYQPGMRLFLTLPFSKEPTAINREYLAEVVRVEDRPEGRYGIGLKLLMEMGGASTFSGTSIQR